MPPRFARGSDVPVRQSVEASAGAGVAKAEILTNTALPWRSRVAKAAGPPAASPGAGILGRQWPMLAAAIAQYEQRTAVGFCDAAYARIADGILRQSDRIALASMADDLAIRPFDAQLLIACTVRQWHLDRPGKRRVGRDGPAREPENTTKFDAPRAAAPGALTRREYHMRLLWVVTAIVAAEAAVIWMAIQWLWR